MRILNRLIVASALVVPMGLGVSGVALADVAAGSSVPSTQIGGLEDDGSKHCEDKTDGLLGGLLGGESKLDDGNCQGADRDKVNGMSR